MRFLHVSQHLFLRWKIFYQWCQTEKQLIDSVSHIIPASKLVQKIEKSSLPECKRCRKLGKSSLYKCKMLTSFHLFFICFHTTWRDKHINLNASESENFFVCAGSRSTRILLFTGMCILLRQYYIYYDFRWCFGALSHSDWVFREIQISVGMLRTFIYYISSVYVLYREYPLIRQ